jgi:hypothetical protein
LWTEEEDGRVAGDEEESREQDIASSKTAETAMA